MAGLILQHGLPSAFLFSLFSAPLRSADINSQQTQPHAQRKADETADGASYGHCLVQTTVCCHRLHADPNRIRELLFGEIRMGPANVRDQFLVGYLQVGERLQHLRDDGRLILAGALEKRLHVFVPLEQLRFVRLDALDLETGNERFAHEEIIGVVGQ